MIARILYRLGLRKRAYDETCRLAPRGWYCTRYSGHLGPCAAWPTFWTRIFRPSVARDFRHGSGLPLMVALVCLLPAIASAQPADAVTATFLAPSDVGSFPITTAITRVDVGLAGVALTFDKADGPNRWPNTCGAPLADPGDACKETRPDGSEIEMGVLQFSFGLALKVGDQWFASAPIQMWHNCGNGCGPGPIQDQSVACSNGRGGQIQCNIFFDASRWGPLASVHPQPGDTVGVFVVAGDARSNFFRVRERSNIVTFPLPASGATASFSFAPGAPPAGPPPVDPPPIVTPPPNTPPEGVTIQQLIERLAAVEAELLARFEAVSKQLQDVGVRIDALEAKPLPPTTCKASVFGVPIHCTVQ